MGGEQVRAWAYEFACDLSLSEMLNRLNEAGPWSWSVRESFWYGDYLKIDTKNGAGQAEIDAIFRELLVALAARQARAIETYD